MVPCLLFNSWSLLLLFLSPSPPPSPTCSPLNIPFLRNHTIQPRVGDWNSLPSLHSENVEEWERGEGGGGLAPEISDMGGDSPHVSTYGELREGFLKLHQNELNVILHLFTGGLGVIGCCCLVYRCSNRSLGTLSLLVALYASSLVGTVPLPLVTVVFVFLAAVVMPVVRAIDLGVIWSAVTVAIAYMGQDAAHYITGEPTFQSTYSGADSMASVSNATTWFSNFSEHTFFLLPLTVDAAVPLMPDALKSWFGPGAGDGAAPAWLMSLRENAWLVVFLAVWVGGCYALDSDSGPFPFMFVKRRMLHCNLGTDALRKDMAAIRKWATDLKPSRDTTTHWWFTDLGPAESAAFTRLATSREVRVRTTDTVSLYLWGLFFGTQGEGWSVRYRSTSSAGAARQ